MKKLFVSINSTWDAGDTLIAIPYPIECFHSTPLYTSATPYKYFQQAVPCSSAKSTLYSSHYNNKHTLSWTLPTSVIFSTSFARFLSLWINAKSTLRRSAIDVTLQSAEYHLTTHVARPPAMLLQFDITTRNAIYCNYLDGYHHFNNVLKHRGTTSQHQVRTFKRSPAGSHRHCGWRGT